MVDVAAKPSSVRRAIAGATIVMQPRTLQLIRAHDAKKGDVLATAQIAGIMGAKRTSVLIPLCHAIELSHVGVEFTPQGATRLEVRCSVRCIGQTGVEMEALMGVSIAALTVYDMCKAVDRGMRVESVRLEEKRGGRSGTFRRAKRR
ncbi:MAG: cyclic pyranopterin monophosphate synthase MoaC [Candidatus Eremiobacteraeota bacterium]|nr:cyclic pyranopterin monophosphate synthase MoaC [Candidatus Eremiobacteraeota bacterium]